MNEFFTRFDSISFEKTRLSALMILWREGSTSFSQLKGRLKAADGSLYTHMEKLQTSGYVEKRKEVAGLSVQTVYSLTETGRALVAEYLAFMESLVKKELEDLS